LGRERARPVGLGLEREAVQVRRDVARRTGVGVLAPRAPDVARLLEDRERLDPGALELHAHGDAREAGADDDDREVFHFTDNSIIVGFGAQPRSQSGEESKSEPRRRLLQAAAALLGENGSGGLSASAVARAAQVAQPTFYVHFRDKDDLLRTLGEEQLGPL